MASVCHYKKKKKIHFRGSKKFDTSIKMLMKVLKVLHTILLVMAAELDVTHLPVLCPLGNFSFLLTSVYTTECFFLL